MTMTSITDTGEAAPFDRKGVRWQVVAWFLAVVVTALTTYNATASGFDKRLSVLESQRDEIDRRMVRIEEKLDRLLYRQ